MHSLTLLPSYSPLHMDSQTQPADPPSGYTFGHPSPRLRDNRGRRVAAHHPSAGTSIAARIRSVSERRHDKRRLKPDSKILAERDFKLISYF